MTNLSPGGGDFPKTIYPYYSGVISTFTVPALSVGNQFEIPNTRRGININSVVNQAQANFGTDQDLMGSLAMAGSCKVTTNTTDATELRLEYSDDGGTTWSPIDNVALDAASLNKSFADYNGFTVLPRPLLAIPNNRILFRTAVYDGTSPSTDILTITNIQVQALIMITG